MTVYRIQSKQDKKCGAYTAPVLNKLAMTIGSEMRNAHTNCTGEFATHPSPYYDKGIERFIKSDEHCGFDSAAKLLRWFRGFIPKLLQAGYEIVALQDVEITAVGKRQVLFKFSGD